MCGIVGIISKNKGGLYQTDLNMFKNMLVVDSLRGEDSTGVFGIHKNLQAKTIKVAAEPHMLFRTEQWRSFEPKAIATMRILVGHNRYATRGAVNNDNAHPFNEGKIILVHNGTISNQKEFNSTVEVDSHAITHALNERPAKEVLSEINGAFALVWYNREEGKMYIARNTERPLYYINTTTNTYFASEGNMLEYILNRSNNGVQHKAYAFPVGKLISYNTKGETESEDFDLYRPKPLGGYQQTYLPGRIISPITETKSYTEKENKNKLDYNEPVIVTINSVTSEKNGVIRCTGKLINPANGTDFSGRFDTSIPIDDVYDLVGTNSFAEGTIAGSINTTCGLSYYVRNIRPAETISVYNKTKLPRVLWNHICKHHKCDKCEGDILTQEADITSVKVKNLSYKFRIICGNCVIEALDEKTKPSNIETSDSTLQDYEQISQSLENWNNANLRQESAVH